MIVQKEDMTGIKSNVSKESSLLWFVPFGANLIMFEVVIEYTHTMPRRSSIKSFQNNKNHGDWDHDNNTIQDVAIIQSCASHKIISSIRFMHRNRPISVQ